MAPSILQERWFFASHTALEVSVIADVAQSRARMAITLFILRNRVIVQKEWKDIGMNETAMSAW